jgi:hypothetical protein
MVCVFHRTVTLLLMWCGKTPTTGLIVYCISLPSALANGYNEAFCGFSQTMRYMRNHFN